jgi:16S rRNA processing protein RimM
VTDVPGELVCVGVIVRARGVIGELEIKPLGENAVRLAPGQTVYLEKSEGQTARPYVVAALRRLNDRLGLTLEGVTTPEQARLLKGESVMVDAEWLPDLPEGHYYHYQIVGLTVVDGEGRTLGRIEEILTTGGNDVYVVREGKEEILLPATDEVVRVIDLAAGRMTVDVPPGLID